MWIDPFTRMLVARIERKPGQSITHYRSSLGLIEGYTSIVINAILAAAKGVLGVLSGSVAVTADAIHSLSDCLSSGVLVIGAYVARRPPDKEHPFGHGRAEHIASIVISILLGVAAVEFGKTSVERILNPQPIEVSWLFVGIIGLTVLIKLWNSIFAFALAKKSNSTAIEADYLHHMTDVVSTVLAIVAMVAGRFGYGQLDGYMGLGVTLIILYATWQIAKEAINPLMGEAPDEEELLRIRRLASESEHVLNVHDVIIHRYGDVRLISLHVEISDRHDTWEAHNIAEDVQQRLGDGMHGTVTVHIDPINDGHPHYDDIRRTLESWIAETKELESMHDLRLAGDDSRFAVVFDLKTTYELNEEQEAFFKKRITRRLKNRFPQIIEVSIYIEPLFSYSTDNLG